MRVFDDNEKNHSRFNEPFWKEWNNLVALLFYFFITNFHRRSTSRFNGPLNDRKTPTECIQNTNIKSMGTQDARFPFSNPFHLLILSWFIVFAIRARKKSHIKYIEHTSPSALNHFECDRCFQCRNTSRIDATIF